jgi:hypothetical protein
MGLSVRASAQQTKWIVAHWTTVVDGLGVEVSPLKTRAHVHRSEESTGLYPSGLSRLQRRQRARVTRRRSGVVEAEAAAMAVMEKLKIFVVKEPVVAASCLIAGFGTQPSLPSANPTRCAPCARALGAQRPLISVCLGLVWLTP